jgi:hypothetical protein
MQVSHPEQWKGMCPVHAKVMHRRSPQDQYAPAATKLANHPLAKVQPRGSNWVNPVC